MINKDIKIALVFENLFSYGGATVVNQKFVEMFPQADIYALFGNQKFSDEYFGGKRVKFSFLNKYPFIKKLHTHYLPFWPVAIESFNLSKYDLVISSSHAVAKGCITSQDSVHISYIHSPMRFLWDLKDTYSKYGLLKAPMLNYIRMWDVASANRPDKVVTGSKFVSNRCKRYWGRDADIVINPPVKLYEGDILPYSKRDNYFVSGAPFAENKGGEFLIQCARELGFELKIIGRSRGYKKLKRMSKGLENVQFLGRVTQEQKWDILKNSKGFLATGIEDFGIFPVESISCGSPVLALERGGYKESVTDGVSGVFYSSNELNSFKRGMEKIQSVKWEVEKMKESVEKFREDRFKREVEEFIRKSI